MKYIQPYSDKRYGLDKLNTDVYHPLRCIYCNNIASNGKGDHVPAKCFLVKPYPTGGNTLVTLPSCENCNNNTSLDEEYVSFLFKYIKFGDNSDEVLQFKNYISLNERILSQVDKESNTIQIENDRLMNVLKRYGYALARYECSVSININPIELTYGLISNMSQSQYDNFQYISIQKEVAQEIGARSSQLIIIEADYSISTYIHWKIVQDDIFRYVAFANIDNNIEVRMVFYDMFYVHAFFTQH